MQIKNRIVSANCKFKPGDLLTSDALKVRAELKKNHIGGMNFQQLATSAWLLLAATAEKEGWTIDTDIEAYLRSL